MKLLLVNDAVLELHSMAREIKWNNYGILEVFTAESVPQAKTIFKEQDIDILLCDIEMPGEDGISLIRWIREMNYDVDCILLTCHADFHYAKEAISLNCREYILLPAIYEDIGDTVHRIVHSRKERFEANQLQEYGKNWIKQHEDKAPKQEKAPTNKETIALCEAYIQEHLDDPNLNVNEIGEHFYMNAIYLSRIFKKEKGVAINQWIITKRMELAKHLLESSSMPATSVANLCGYANYPYFSTVFKKHYGYSPTQCLEKNKKE